MQYNTINWKEKALSFENINVSTSIRIISSISDRKFTTDWCGQNGYIPNSEKGFGIYRCYAILV
jgi:hypothetical protein